jgi:hypothetical protein
MISVTVNTSAKPCTVSVDQPFVSSEVSRNLMWTIVTAGYSFAENGIVFEDAQFEPQPAPGVDKFIVHNKFSSKGDFPYSVNVETCQTLDPYVRN